MTPLESKSARRAVSSEMKKATVGATIAIFGCTRPDAGELIGTGTILRVGSALYLLTAAHVFEKGLGFWAMARSAGYGQHPRLLSGPYWCRSRPTDLGLARVDDLLAGGVVTDHESGDPPFGLLPVDAARLAARADDIGPDLLFLQGFPGAESRFLETFGGICSQTLPLVTFPGGHSASWFNPAVNFALEYSQNVEDENGRPATLPDPHGLSGSAVWRTHRNKHGVDGWTSEEARIVGIVTSWDQPAGSLIATRIEAVRDFLLDTLRNRYAYSNWLDRGCPAGDDWTDWFAAVEKIPEV
jgi:hypothetical protein